MSKRTTPYILLLPAMFILMLCAIIPILMAFGISLTNLDTAGLGNTDIIKFLGMQNYQELFKDRVFIQAIKNTFYYVIVGVPIVVVCSFFLALLISIWDGKIFNGFRAVFYMPSITNMVAVSVIWAYLFNPTVGLFNRILEAGGLDPILWLQDPSVAKNSLLLLSVWRNMGVNILIFNAAIKGIPKSYFEAAEIDGATAWQRLIYIIIPSIKFSTFFVVITTLIGWFQYFEEPYIMTKGGPLNSTIPIVQFIYQSGFKSNRLGYASAASMVLFFIIFVVTMVQFIGQIRQRRNQ